MQAMHALQEFNIVHPTVAKRWHKDSNYLGLLSVANEDELERVLGQAQDAGLYTAAFHEPDLDHTLTAIAIEPDPRTRKLLAKLPLALRHPV